MILRSNNLIKLILWILFFESVGFLLGLLTQANIYSWYEPLHKSLLTPPGFIFSIVWILLYALLAVIAWILTLNKRFPNKVRVLFTIQMLMNWSWSPMFFGLHWLIPSAIWLISLTCLNLILILEAKKTNKTIAWLLIPYTIWLIFASYLNVIIALRN